MIGPCLCGDTDCPTCGTAQGTREPRGLCGETEAEHYAGDVDDEPHPRDVGDLGDVDDEPPVYAGDLLDGITEALRNLPDDCGRLDAASVEARVHIVERGESLHTIAAFHTGDPLRWREILDANPTSRIVHEPHMIFPGMSLVLPASWPAFDVPRGAL